MERNRDWADRANADVFHIEVEDRRRKRPNKDATNLARKAVESAISSRKFSDAATLITKVPDLLEDVMLVLMLFKELNRAEYVYCADEIAPLLYSLFKDQDRDFVVDISILNLNTWLVVDVIRYMSGHPLGLGPVYTFLESFFEKCYIRGKSPEMKKVAIFGLGTFVPRLVAPGTPVPDVARLLPIACHMADDKTVPFDMTFITWCALGCRCDDAGQRSVEQIVRKLLTWTPHFLEETDPIFVPTWLFTIALLIDSNDIAASYMPAEVLHPILANRLIEEVSECDSRTVKDTALDECLTYIADCAVIYARLEFEKFDSNCFFNAKSRNGVTLIKVAELLASHQNREVLTGMWRFKQKPYLYAFFAVSRQMKCNKDFALYTLRSSGFVHLVASNLPQVFDDVASEEAMLEVMNTLIWNDACYATSLLRERVGPFFIQHFLVFNLKPRLLDEERAPCSWLTRALEFAAAVAFHSPQVIPGLIERVNGFGDLLEMAFDDEDAEQAPKMLCLANFAASAESRHLLARQEFLGQFMRLSSDMDERDFDVEFGRAQMQAISNMAKEIFWRDGLACCTVACAIRKSIDWTISKVSVPILERAHQCSLSLCAIINTSSRCLNAKKEFERHNLFEQLGKIFETFLNHRQVIEFALWSVFNTCRDYPSSQVAMKQYSVAKAMMAAFTKWKSDERVAARACKAIFAICKRNVDNRKFYSASRLNTVEVIKSCGASQELKQQALAALK